MVIAGGHERAYVFLAFGDDERDVLHVCHPFWPEAVDVIRRNGQEFVGQSPLGESFHVDGTQFDVGDATLHGVDVSETLAVGIIDPRRGGLAAKHLGAESEAERHHIVESIVVEVEVSEAVDVGVIECDVV